MATGEPAADAAREETILLATFESRRRAELMVASLPRRFRRLARRRRASAIVVSANADGSFNLTQSRAQTAGAMVAALLRVAAAWALGFLGLSAALKGGKDTHRAARVHQSRVGADDRAAQALLAAAGPRSAAALVRCEEPDLTEEINARAEKRAIDAWHGSMAELRAALDPGNQHDWVRTALEKTYE